MSQELINTNRSIESYIYTIRGIQVMLDSDLAFLYGVETGALNRQMKRNIERFPERYCFRLNEEEYLNLKCQNGISSLNAGIANNLEDNLKFQKGTSSFKGNYGGRRKLPYVYTEQGVSMLSAVLRSKTAVEMSIKIIDSFVHMRRFIQNNNYLLDKVINIEKNQKEIKNELITYKGDSDKKFNEIFNYISDHKESNEKIFYNGQIFEADDVLIKLINEANKEIILIDNYIDIKTLDLLSYKNKDVSVNIYTSKRGNYLKKSIIDDFNNEHKYLTIYYKDIFHDRYLILDKKEIYLVGASLRDAGSKCFSLIKLDKSNIKRIMELVK